MGNETKNDRRKVLEYLGGYSQVKMSTSATLKGIVHREYVLVHEAPPAALIGIVNRFRFVSLSPEGLLIPTNLPED